jgi:hypothetical protein
MSIVKVDAGVCRFKTKIKVKKTGQNTCKVTIESDCPAVKKVAQELSECNIGELKKSFVDSIVYNICAKYLKHVTCPVPTAILKAVEVGFGLALPKDVYIEIKEECEE